MAYLELQIADVGFTVELFRHLTTSGRQSGEMLDDLWHQTTTTEGGFQ